MLGRIAFVIVLVSLVGAAIGRTLVLPLFRACSYVFLPLTNFALITAMMVSLLTGNTCPGSCACSCEYYSTNSVIYRCANLSLTSVPGCIGSDATYMYVVTLVNLASVCSLVRLMGLLITASDLSNNNLALNSTSFSRFQNLTTL